MKEQSHKSEMSAAIRGDFKRLRDRGVAATLAPRDDDVPEPVEIVPEIEEPVLAAVVGEEPEVLSPKHERPEERVVTAPATAPVEPDGITDAVEADEPGATEPPGFFSRLFGR